MMMYLSFLLDSPLAGQVILWFLLGNLCSLFSGPAGLFPCSEDPLRTAGGPAVWVKLNLSLSSTVQIQGVHSGTIAFLLFILKFI